MKAALSAMMVKTDRKDARGLAQLSRMGWFRPVHAKSMDFGRRCEHCWLRASSFSGGLST